MKKYLYIAGPLFSQAELDFNITLKRDLLPFFDIYLPQEDGQLLVNLLKNGVPLALAKKSIFAYDMAAIERAEYLLIILDGRTVDEGAAFELGVAYNLGKKCLGLQTDPRRLLSTGNNPMLDCALNDLFLDKSELLTWAKTENERTHFEIADTNESNED